MRRTHLRTLVTFLMLLPAACRSNGDEQQSRRAIPAGSVAAAASPAASAPAAAAASPAASAVAAAASNPAASAGFVGRPPVAAKDVDRNPGAVSDAARARLTLLNEPGDPASKSRWSAARLAERPLPKEAPRLYAKTRHVWIYAEPDATKQWIGYLWSGGSVRLRDTKPRYGVGCDYFYAIEPRGYVCIDGGRATLDPSDPVVMALHPYAPRADSPWPHRYGESRGAPLYLQLPSAAEQVAREPGLRRHLDLVESARLTQRATGPLLGVDLTPADEQAFELPKLSPSVHEAYAALKNRSTVAYSHELRAGARDFLLTADYRFVPKDRVVPYPVSRFHGLRLGLDAQLPLAYFRRERVTRYRREANGAFTEQGPEFDRLAHVELTGKSERYEGVEYLETRAGDWVIRDSAVIPTPAARTPWNAEVGTTDTSPLRPKGRATWLEVSIRGGWLLAYEGTTPVFVTLISPGRGGEPLRGRDPLETSATPVGRFSITGKFVTSTMVAPNDYLHADVPYAQNFTGPYALHAAYWHDNWGNLMSGGCINLSPIDALFMFQWTEPPAPNGWHGTRWLPYLEPATILIIHR